MKAASLRKPDYLSNRAKTMTTPSRVSRPLIVERYSSDNSPKNSFVKKFDVDAMLSSSSFEDGTAKEVAIEPDELNPLTSGDAGHKVDSKNDFMSALTASLATESDQDSSSQKGGTSQSTENTFKVAPAQGPAARRRGWNTLPLKGLPSIQEYDGK